MSERKSGIRDPFAEVEELDLSSFTAPYSHFVNEYNNRLTVQRKAKYGRPYLVTYVDEPDLFFITFQQNKDRAKGVITKYLKESMHPNFIGRRWRSKYNKCRAIVVPEFEPYAKSGKVPVNKLMEVLGVKVSCAGCGEHTFTYEDLKEKRCFLVEGEGGINGFSEGFVVCYNCYQHLLKGN